MKHQQKWPLICRFWGCLIIFYMTLKFGVCMKMQMVYTLLSGQNILWLSSACLLAVNRMSFGCHPAVFRLSSGCHPAVIRTHGHEYLN